MTEPVWLSPADVEALQSLAIERDGGLSGGLTRLDLLESALARPQNEFAYAGQEDVFTLAATYAEGIAKNHAFADANKRTAFLAAAKFLLDNGVQLQLAKGVEHADMMVDFVNDDISREEMAAHLKAHSRQLDSDAQVDHGQSIEEQRDMPSDRVDELRARYQRENESASSTDKQGGGQKQS